MSKILSFVNIKGGTGKTTLVTNLSVMLSQQKKKVAVLDLDPQGSSESFLIDYGGEMSNLTHRHVPLSAFGSIAKLTESLNNNDLIIFDVGGGDLSNAHRIMPITNSLILPARPSKKDIASTSAMLISMSQSGDFTANPNMNAYIVLNQCSFHPKSTTADEAEEALQAVINHIGRNDRIFVMRSRLNVATAWIEADMQCVTINEVGKCKAADQFKQLVKEMKKRGII